VLINFFDKFGAIFVWLKAFPDHWVAHVRCDRTVDDAPNAGGPPKPFEKSDSIELLCQ